MTLPEVKHIGILLFNDVEELDAIGPWEVLSYWTRHHPEDGFAVSCLSKSGGLVQCSKAWRCKPTTPTLTRRPLRCWSTPEVRALAHNWRMNHS